LADLGEKLEPVARSLLEPGEELRGVCIATQSSLFKGRMVALVITDGRLVVQGMSRRFAPDGEPLSLPPEKIAAATAEGGGGGWMDLGAAVMDKASVALKIRTADGEKLKLLMMRAEGALAGLGGGETQRQGIEALGAWFAERG
jgi:hypothetical protein